jgi:D-amino-acid oxidase
VLLGGTFQDHQWSLEPDPATAESIIQRCTRLDPTLEGAEVIAHRVGLRPGRPSVRLEPEQIEGGVVIHNYGHGAIGHTLAWGCAAAAAVLAESLLSVP